MADAPALNLPPIPASAFDRLLDQTGGLVYAVEGERVVTLNGALRRDAQLDSKAITDLSELLRLLYPDPAVREGVAAVHQSVFAGATVRPVEWTLTTTLGEARQVRWQLSLPRPGLLVALGEDVTDRRRLEKWVRLQNNLLESVPEAVLVADLSGNVLHWTGAAERLFGPDESNALGRPLARILPGPTAASVVQEWVAAARTEPQRRFTRELQKENGETLECEVDLHRIQDERGGMIAIALIVAPARVATAATEGDTEAVGLDKALAAVGTAAVILTGMDGAIHAWSTGAERLGSLTSGRARGRRLFDEVLTVQGLSWEGLSTRLASRPRHTMRGIVERANGTRVPVDLDAVLIRSPEGPQGVLVVLVDRSEAQALADEAALTKARALPGAVGEGVALRLADTLSWFEPNHRVVHARLHDLVLLGQLVASGATSRQIETFLAHTAFPPGGADAWEALDRLSEGVTRLRHLVDSLTRFTSSDPEPPGPVRLVRELEAARLLVGPRVAGTAEIALTVEELPAARASRGPLVRALCLLLLAAAESASEGGDGKITIEGHHQHGWVQLEIRDNGAGYAVEVQSRLGESSWLAGQPGFAPFFLGLARDAARLAGGTMELVTAPGTGARVKLAFPAAEGAAAVLPLDAPRPHVSAYGRVLLVEEDELLRRATERFIAEYHHVSAFASVADALLALPDGGFDAAVVSLTRPDALGLKLLGAVTDAAPTLRANVVVVVPNAIRSATRDALVDRGHVVLARPYDLTTLRSLLVRLVPLPEVTVEGEVV